MLFTDADFISQADLQSIDSEVGKVKGATTLVVEGAGSIIRNSIQESGHHIKSRLQSFGGYLMGGNSSAHVAAVQNTGTSSISWPVIRLNQVVVSEPDPTKTEFRRWVMFKALEDFYRACMMRVIEDRFEKKMNFYGYEAKRAWAILASVGVPIVLTPLACPGALRECNPGTWGAANVSAVAASSSETGRSFDVAITWVNSPTYVSPSQRMNGESAPSIIATIAVPAGDVIAVDITSLNAPTGAYPDIGTADRLFSPMAATGWNLYVGLTGNTLYLQNPSPIPVATKTRTLASVPLLSGVVSPAGQASVYNFSVQPLLQRA